MLNLDYKEMMAGLTAIIATVAWFIRLEARGLRNKEKVEDLKEALKEMQAQRKADLEEAREARRLSDGHLRSVGEKIDQRFERVQSTMEQILVALGNKADR